MYRLIEKLHLDRYLSSRLILMLDMVASTASTIVAMLLVGSLFYHTYPATKVVWWWLAGSAVFSLAIFLLLQTHKSIIRHSTLRELWKLGVAAMGKIVLLWLMLLLLSAADNTSLQVPATLLLDMLITLVVLISMRVVMIVVYDALKRSMHRMSQRSRTLVYGTGDKSVSLVTRLQNSPHYKVEGFLTFGARLKNHTLAELPVCYFENEDNIVYLREKYDIDAVLFAYDDDARVEQERLIRYCLNNGINILIAPSIDEIIDGKVMRQPIREVKIEDLLGRDEIRISMADIEANFAGKTVLVTGAAGSIGSELCRQLAGFGVKELVLYDNAETPMHNLRLELEERFPELTFTPIIGDVRLPARLDYAFRDKRPQVVFHAAAYKHVPLMEENPCEAVLVNVAGSRNVADKCVEYDVEMMVMISTDKAVNPTNVMGCTKRLAEIYVQSLGLAIDQKRHAGRTKFVTTRFGNVLGSNGSVIPRFREQIAKGGPVTVTHPDITRFFMTIPEACRLVMEAATMSTGNQIFVFDMGRSVKIADLARRMIELAGLVPDYDIKIEYTGLRPGEKLYEEVLSNHENTLPTTHNRIRIAKVREYDYEDARVAADSLEHLSRVVEIPDMVRLMKRTVPEFKSKNSRFEELDKELEAENQPSETTKRNNLL